MDPIARYPSLSAFYDADRRRQRSQEADFGITWRDGIATPANWRLSWVEVTGEVYAHELRPAGIVVVLARCLRRPVVDRLLGGQQPDHALARAWAAMRFPPLAPGWSGYVALASSGDCWVAARGWWARPLAAQPYRWRARSAAGDQRRAGSDPVQLASAILSDRGWPPSGRLARQLAGDVVARRAARGATCVPDADVAAWAGRTAPFLERRVGDRRSA